MTENQVREFALALSRELNAEDPNGQYTSTAKERMRSVLSELHFIERAVRAKNAANPA